MHLQANKKRSATFLKGSVGSFSRGGLMVTHEGRVIYKVNQDRGLISHPSLNRARHTVFGVFDGEYSSNYCTQVESVRVEFENLNLNLSFWSLF